MTLGQDGRSPVRQSIWIDRQVLDVFTALAMVNVDLPDKVQKGHVELSVILLDQVKVGLYMVRNALPLIVARSIRVLQCNVM